MSDTIRDTSNLVLLAITAAAEFAGHALSLGDTDGVFWATGRGLQVLPGHEELIGSRMRAHARAGDLAGVRQEWESYERILVAEAWSDGEPAPKLLALRRELLGAMNNGYSGRPRVYGHFAHRTTPWKRGATSEVAENDEDPARRRGLHHVV